MAFSFGANTTTQPGGFGTVASKPMFSFGSNTGTTNTGGFGSFGAGSFGANTTTTSAFGSIGISSTGPTFGGLGAPQTSTAPTLFGSGFGSTAAKPTGFGTGGFGSTAFGTGTNFGTGAGTSAFSGTTTSFGTGTLGGSAFGTIPSFGTNTLGGTSFGSAFGVKPTTGFGGFGTGLGTTNAFGQQQQQAQQPGAGLPTTAQEALAAAVANCWVFGDERDQVLAKWNSLQAQWGTGHAYYNKNAPPLELTEQNPYCRFKAVGYSRLGGREDSEGHVALLFQKSEQELKNNQQSLITSLFSLLGNKANLSVNIETIRAMSENKTQVVIYVVDASAGGSHVSATELSNFLNTASPRTALSGAGCINVTAVTRPSPQALAQYLQTSPPGMHITLWKQAQADNPDSENYIPVPIVGFSEIKFRAQCQAEQAALQDCWLRRSGEQLAELRTRRAASTAHLAQLTQRLHTLQHTLLQVIGRMEVHGRVGASLSPEEEATRARLHELASQLAAPPLYNGRLNELLCAVRLQRSASAGAPHERYQLDPGANEDMKQFLALQQRGMAHLLETARQDLAALNTISEGMARLVHS